MGTPLPFLGKAIVGCSFTSKEKGRKRRHDNKLYLNVVYLLELYGAKIICPLEKNLMITGADEIQMLINKRGRCLSYQVTQNQEERKLSFEVAKLPPYVERLLLVKRKYRATALCVVSCINSYYEYKRTRITDG